MQPVRSKRHAGNRTRIAAFAVPLLALALPFAAAAPTSAATLDHIKQTSTITLGYRADARPFSFRDDANAPAGYSVELCKKIADQVKSDLGLSDLTVTWVPVTLEDRFSAVAEGKVDLLCAGKLASANLALAQYRHYSLAVGENGHARLHSPAGSVDQRGVSVNNTNALVSRLVGRGTDQEDSSQ